MFKFINRKEEKSIVLIPGWAFDFRIFATMDLKYNYFFYSSKNKSITCFEDELKNLLNEYNLDKISILGWSQGAFLSCDFAYKNPEIIDELILVGIKIKYEKEILEDIKKYIIKNKIAYLYKFYAECFCKDDEKYFTWFRKNLLSDYLQNMETEDLIDGLDRLSYSEINPKSLNDIKEIKIVHGEKDKISALDEAIALKNDLPQSKLVVFNDTGHLPFLKGNFKELLYDL
ncbi:MAG: alpha/beta fold hydrolase [Elusimicrobia bacterium]|nr:alpha/beta fold hydrolase [Elusimicrobiota bacterium]